MRRYYFGINRVNGKNKVKYIFWIFLSFNFYVVPEWLFFLEIRYNGKIIAMCLKDHNGAINIFI